METYDTIILKLNEFIESGDFSLHDFELSFRLLPENLRKELKFLDFNFYSEERREAMWQEKMSWVRAQKFETAAAFRQKEKECIEHLELKKNFNAEESRFIHDGGTLYYCFFGTARNDIAIKQFLIGE